MKDPAEQKTGVPNHYFVLAQSANADYQDKEGSAYHYPLKIPNARKIGAGDLFVYYRPGNNDASRYFFGYGRVDQVVAGTQNDATAIIGDYVPFKSLVPRLALGAEVRKSLQHSISVIDRATFDQLVQAGMVESVRAKTDKWLYVLTASGPAARSHYNKTIAQPLDPEQLRKFVPPEDLPESLEDLRAWGALPGPRNIAIWEQMTPGDWVLTYWNRTYHDVSRVVAKFNNADLAAALWGRDESSGETWRYMYLMERPKSLGIESEKAADWLPSSYQGFSRISEARVGRIVERFGNVRQFIESGLGTMFVAEPRPIPFLNFEEQFLQVHQFIQSRGYVIHTSDLANFITCLRVKPFIILAGVSGIGKSRLVRVFGEAIGARVDVIPVQPNWTDNSDLFGYVDPVRHVLVPGRCTTALREAEALGGQPFFLCLDEMNLAHVEHYFADFLSVLESRRLDDLDQIVTDDLIANQRAQLGIQAQEPEAWPSLPFPNNAFVIGTVNMDETTHPFSRKVLDRANTIELTNMSLTTVLPPSKDRQLTANFDWEFLLPSVISLGQIYEDDQRFFDAVIAELTKINGLLQPLNQHFAYRVRDEICLYRYFAKDLPAHLTEEMAMDYQILQKILPRLHGSSEATKRALTDLFQEFVPGTNAANPDRFDVELALKEAPSARYSMSARKIALMLDRFQSDGFTSFWL